MPTCPYCHQTWSGTHHCTGHWQRKTKAPPPPPPAPPGIGITEKGNPNG